MIDLMFPFWLPTLRVPIGPYLRTTPLAAVHVASMMASYSALTARMYLQQVGDWTVLGAVG